MMGRKDYKKEQKPFFSDLEKTQKDHMKNSMIGIALAAAVLIVVIIIVELGLV